VRAPLTATAIVLFLVLAYPVSCWVRPMRDCWCCKGTGHHRAEKNRKLSRPCRWCGQTGKRMRIGRRMWNRARRVHREAN
jgi:hypothetical protein